MNEPTLPVSVGKSGAWVRSRHGYSSVCSRRADLIQPIFLPQSLPVTNRATSPTDPSAVPYPVLCCCVFLLWLFAGAIALANMGNKLCKKKVDGVDNVDNAAKTNGGALDRIFNRLHVSFVCGQGFRAVFLCSLMRIRARGRCFIYPYEHCDSS